VGTNRLVNRVAVDKPLSLRSVNGPEVTVIQGYQVPSTTNGDTAIRCVYLANDATLSGFTLTNGATRALNDWDYVESSGGGVWCESTNAAVSNCVVTGNSAFSASGGASGGALYNCTLSGNSARISGGGAGGGLFSNQACVLNNCTLSGNAALMGGGAAGGWWSQACILNNCTLSGNVASSEGGGAANSTLHNCVLRGNSAGESGGGAIGGTLNNCTVTGNSAPSGGGVASVPAFDVPGCVVNNSLVYYNSARDGSANYDFALFSYCCTTPLPEYGDPEYGVGNISADPQLVSASHLSAFSPCRGAGSPDYARGTDIDGEAWANPPSIGCDEYHAEALTGPLVVSIGAEATNVAPGYPLSFTALIEGRPSLCLWDFDDGALSFDRPYEMHRWTAPGDYVVSLWALNESHPDGVSASVTIHVLQAPVHYVELGNPNPIAPYLSWATAATNLQDAVDQAFVGATVLVSNGVYATGGRAVYDTGTNRVAINKLLTVRSVNGPQFTVIRGDPAGIRCAYLASGASLSGFALTNGAADDGAGIYCESLAAVVSNCVISGNSATYSGGGAYDGTFYNCALTGNSGSGAEGSTLNNCTLTGNSGGGAFLATLNNCIVYYNTGTNYGYSSLDYCCTTPLPGWGTGNLAEEPQLASAWHLSANSPCRGRGSPAHASGLDLDGEPWANPPSIGCDELRAGAVTGPLSVGIAATFTNVAVGYPVGLTALIEGRLTASVWDLRDGVSVTNQPYVTHAWMAPGDYAVVLQAYNETYPAGVSATVTVRVGQGIHYVAVDSSNPLAPYDSWATAARSIQDAVDASEPGGLVLVTNGTYATGGRAVGANLLVNRVAVDKALSLRSVNGPQFTTIRGYQVPGMTNGDGAVRCVYLASGASLSGFTLSNGATRELPGDDLLEECGGGAWCEGRDVTVSNCVVMGNSAAFSGGGVWGGTINNCTLSSNSAGGAGGGAASITLNNCTLSFNSARGGGGAYGGRLTGCTLFGNSAGTHGGGANGSSLCNCILRANSAYYGGGVSSCPMDNCTLTGNTAAYGGGADWSWLTNCTLTGNAASADGGGMHEGTLNNCIVYFNSAQRGPNYNYPEGYWAVANYSCTMPMNTNGLGNITNAPLFLDYAGGNLRLQSNSPCINAGNNAYAVGDTDLDGNPRMVSGTVDIGAYEFQGPGSVISYAWLQGYGLPTDGSADFTDPDHDGLTTWQEWRCQTDPTNALSALRLLSASPNGTNVSITWHSVAGVNYVLEWSTNLASPYIPLATGIPGQSGSTTYTDTNAADLAPLFYRVGVGN
jgi:hypothetical protein